MRVAHPLSLVAFALGLVPLAAHAADPGPEARLVVTGRGRGAVVVRGVGVEAKAELGKAVTLRVPAAVLVRVDFGAGDFYEAYVELASPGEHTLTVPEGKSRALVAGKKTIPLSRGVPVTLFRDDPRWTFVDRDTGDDMPAYGPRWIAEGKKGVRIEQVILHATLTASAEEGLAALLARALSTHLFVARDGTVIQALDLDACAYHAGDRNPRGIGLDLVGILPNLRVAAQQMDLALSPDGAEAFAAEAEADDGGPTARPPDPNAGVSDPTLLLPVSAPAVINGAPVQSYGYSARAVRSLEAVLLALWRAYPTLGRHVASELAVLADPATAGVLTHWQAEAQRWDPGPGLDLARLGRMAALVAALERR